MSPLHIGVVKETAARERRVALTPDAVPRLAAAGMRVLVESHAGAAALFTDKAYATSGAGIVATDELYDRSDVIVTVAGPEPWRLRPGQTVLALRRPGTVPDGVSVLAFAGLPRTLSAAQPMDALTSQANIAGYKAAVRAASGYGRFFPLLVTAAGTARPAQVLVLGAGVAGLQAIGTARRLGAVVTAYDLRPQARADAASVGALFLDLPGVQDAAGAGGYARPLTKDERHAQQAALAARIERFDVVIATAQVPGGRPPLLLTENAIKAMRPGSVIVDLAASDLGGNVHGSRPGERYITDGGVTILGADDLPSTMAAAASEAYAHNVTALLLHLVRDGSLVLDPDDEITAGVTR